MSVITDMILLANGDDMDRREGLKALNAWCREHGAGQQFERISTQAAGGRKVFTAEIFGCAGDHFPWEKLMEAFPSFPWGSEWDRERTVLLVQPERTDWLWKATTAAVGSKSVDMATAAIRGVVVP